MPDEHKLRDRLADSRRRMEEAEGEASKAKEKLMHELAVNSVRDLDPNRVDALTDDITTALARHEALQGEYERWRELL